MLSRISLTILSFYLTAATLLAQTGPEPVNSPQRGTTYADNAEVWYSQPFVWMGLGIVLLIVVLLVLRGKNRPTNGALHGKNSEARPRDAKPAS